MSADLALSILPIRPGLRFFNVHSSRSCISILVTRKKKPVQNNIFQDFKERMQRI